MNEQLRVYSAACLGFITPFLDGLLNIAEPLLKVLLLLGQVGVAAVTILYILRKWHNARQHTHKK
jgi:hypothetical protein